MDNQLTHYGVLGMKWGVRRNPSKAYANSMVKRNRLEREAETAKNKKNLAKSAYESAKRTRQDTEERMKTAENKVSATGRIKDRADADLAIANMKSNSLFKDLNIYSKRKEADRATDSHNKALSELTSISKKFKNDLYNEDVASENLSFYASAAEKAISKSQRWNRIMDSTFKDVSPDAIAAGEELLKNRTRK